MYMYGTLLTVQTDGIANSSLMWSGTVPPSLSWCGVYVVSRTQQNNKQQQQQQIIMSFYLLCKIRSRRVGQSRVYQDQDGEELGDG